MGTILRTVCLCGGKISEDKTPLTVMPKYHFFRHNESSNLSIIAATMCPPPPPLFGPLSYGKLCLEFLHAFIGKTDRCDNCQPRMTQVLKSRKLKNITPVIQNATSTPLFINFLPAGVPNCTVTRKDSLRERLRARG